MLSVTLLLGCWWFGVFKELCLCLSRRTTPEKFYIEPCDDGSEDVLAIDRVSTEMTLTGKHNIMIRYKETRTGRECWYDPQLVLLYESVGLLGMLSQIAIVPV